MRKLKGLFYIPYVIVYICTQKEVSMIDADRIRLRRLELRLSQGKLGALIGQDQAYISRLERSVYGEITVRTLERLARALQVPVATLLKPEDDERVEIKPAAVALVDA